MDKTLRQINNVIAEIRQSINPDLAISQLAVFVAVALEEGVRQSDLYEKMSMPQGTLSRNLKILSQYAEPNVDGVMTIKGYDLIAVKPDLYERNKNACYLTEKGKKLAEKLANICSEEE